MLKGAKQGTKKDNIRRYPAFERGVCRVLAAHWAQFIANAELEMEFFVTIHVSLSLYAFHACTK